MSTHSTVDPVAQDPTYFHGYSHTLLGELIDSATIYTSNPLSSMDICKAVHINTTNDYRSNPVLRTRTYTAEPLHPLNGSDFVDEPYYDSYGVEVTYLTSNELNASPRFLLSTALANSVALQSVLRSYLVWKNSGIIGNKRLFDHLMTGSFKLDSLAMASSLEFGSKTFNLPKLENGVVKSPTLTAEIVTTSAYKGQALKVLGAIDSTPSYLPVMQKNYAAFISRYTLRGYSYPSNADNTIPGSQTENVYWGTPRGNVPQPGFPVAGAATSSSEFNLNLIGVALTKKEPLTILEPSSYLKFVVNPLAEAALT